MSVVGSPERIGLVVRTLLGHRQLSATEVTGLIDATAAAGFGEVSIWTVHLDWAAAGGVTAEEFYARHRDSGLAIATSELLTGWATTDLAAVAATNQRVLDQSAQSGAPYVVAIAMEPDLPPIAEAAVGMQHLCDLAADQGMAVSFEFLPFTGWPTIADAARLLDAVDRPNFGLVLDTSHWFRQPGGPDFATLGAIPADRIHVVQLCDLPAARPADPIMETGTARLLPGEGDIDIVGLLDVLAEMGATPAISAEVFSTELMARGPAEFARLQFDASKSVLEQHWAGRAG